VHRVWRALREARAAPLRARRRPGGRRSHADAPGTGLLRLLHPVSRGRHPATRVPACIPAPRRPPWRTPH